MIEEERCTHLIAALRQMVESPRDGLVPMILREFEEKATVHLEDLPPPTWDHGARAVYAAAGAPFERPMWDFTRAEGSHGIGDLIDTLQTGVREAAGGGDDNAGDHFKHFRWQAAADVLRSCALIREYGLTQHYLYRLKETLYRMPARANLPEPESGVGAGAAARTSAVCLSIHIGSRKVSVDGLPQHVPAQPFALLCLLARHAVDGKGAVENRAVEAETQRVARDLVRDLRDALSRGRSDAPRIRDWIESRRSAGGYELALRPEQVEILD